MALYLTSQNHDLGHLDPTSFIFFKRLPFVLSVRKYFQTKIDHVTHILYCKLTYSWILVWLFIDALFGACQIHVRLSWIRTMIVWAESYKVHLIARLGVFPVNALKPGLGADELSIRGLKHRNSIFPCGWERLHSIKASALVALFFNSMPFRFSQMQVAYSLPCTNLDEFKKFYLLTSIITWDFSDRECVVWSDGECIAWES